MIHKRQQKSISGLHQANGLITLKRHEKKERKKLHKCNMFS